MDYGKREAGGPIWILYSHNPLISDLGYFVTRDFFKSFLVCKDLFICKDLFLILITQVPKFGELWSRMYIEVLQIYTIVVHSDLDVKKPLS